MFRIKRILTSNKGEGYIDIVVAVLAIMLVVAFAVNLFPVFTAKQQLDIFANELVRQAEINGNTDLNSHVESLKRQTGLNPTILWECDYYSGKKVQLNHDIKVTLKVTVDIGFFSFGSFPIELNAKSTGKSKVYYK